MEELHRMLKERYHANSKLVRHRAAVYTYASRDEGHVGKSLTSSTHSQSTANYVHQLK
jgi:hypothetical protein